MTAYSLTLTGDSNTYYWPVSTDTQRVAAIIAHRQWLAEWTRWRRRCESIHLARQMHPERGWAWLYARDNKIPERKNDGY